MPANLAASQRQLKDDTYFNKSHTANSRGRTMFALTKTFIFLTFLSIRKL